MPKIEIFPTEINLLYSTVYTTYLTVILGDSRMNNLFVVMLKSDDVIDKIAD